MFVEVKINEIDAPLLTHVIRENDTTLQDVVNFAISEFVELLPFGVVSIKHYIGLVSLGEIEISQSTLNKMQSINQSKTGFVNIETLVSAALWDFVEAYKTQGIIFAKDRI